jgi:hypothetical protein
MKWNRDAMPWMPVIAVRIAVAAPGRNMPCPPRLRGGLALVLALLIAGAGLTGCSLLRPPGPPTLPAGFSATPEAAQLVNPATRQAAYARLFPALPKVQFYGDFMAHNPFLRGIEFCQVQYLAVNEGAASGPRPLRLQATRLMNPAFLVVVREDHMAIVMYPPLAERKTIYEGVIPTQGSQIGKILGVEPWDLVQVFTLGQQIAREPLREHTALFRRRPVLKPADAGGGAGLREVILDRGSGLPAQAVWKTGGKTFEVRFLGWDTFTDTLTGEERRLMPSRLEIRPSWSRTVIALDLKSYQFNATIPGRAFDLPEGSDFRLLPLDAFGKVMPH